MRLTPIALALIRLLGAICPNTDAGTMVGKPTAAAAPKDVLRKLRRETSTCFFIPSPLNAGVGCALLCANH